MSDQLLIMMKFIILVTSLLLFTNTAYCEIYKWVDKQGEIHFGDKKPNQPNIKKLKLKINSYSGISYDISKLDSGGNVILYSTEWCGYCKKAKKYFKKNHIPYTDYDIEKDAKAKQRYKAMGATAVPVIIVGKKRMNGFSVSGFKRIYGK